MQRKSGSWQTLFFLFHWNCPFFCNHTISRTFLYVIILILVHASAVFVKHWHVPTEVPINRNFFTVGQQTSRKRAWCLTSVLISESTIFRKRQKGLFSISLLMTNVSDNSRRCLSPALFNKILAQWRKEVENYAKLQTKVSSNSSCGHVKRYFDIPARKFIQEAAIFLFSVQTCWGKKLFLFRKFFSNGSSRQVESRFVKPAEKNWAKSQVFSGSISDFENN